MCQLCPAYINLPPKELFYLIAFYSILFHLFPFCSIYFHFVSFGSTDHRSQITVLRSQFSDHSSQITNVRSHKSDENLMMLDLLQTSPLNESNLHSQSSCSHRAKKPEWLDFLFRHPWGHLRKEARLSH